MSTWDCIERVAGFYHRDKEAAQQQLYSECFVMTQFDWEVTNRCMLTTKIATPTNPDGKSVIEQAKWTIMLRTHTLETRDRKLTQKQNWPHEP